MKIIKKGREYRIIKVYPAFFLCESEYGYKECFSFFEINGVPKIRQSNMRLPVGNNM